MNNIVMSDIRPNKITVELNKRYDIKTTKPPIDCIVFSIDTDILDGLQYLFTLGRNETFSISLFINYFSAHNYNLTTDDLNILKANNIIIKELDIEFKGEEISIHTITPYILMYFMLAFKDIHDKNTPKWISNRFDAMKQLNPGISIDKSLFIMSELKNIRDFYNNRSGLLTILFRGMRHVQFEDRTYSNLFSYTFQMLRWYQLTQFTIVYRVVSIDSNLLDDIELYSECLAFIELNEALTKEEQDDIAYAKILYPEKYSRLSCNRFRTLAAICASILQPLETTLINYNVRNVDITLIKRKVDQYRAVAELRSNVNLKERFSNANK